LYGIVPYCSNVPLGQGLTGVVGMDIHAQESGTKRPDEAPREGSTLESMPRRMRAFGSERVGQILGEWQKVELRIARGFAECRGLTTEQLEDIYQETTEALYRRPYDSEEHLRNALRDGIKKRALRLHRDERRRGQIRAHSTSGIRLMAEVREEQSAPEPAVLAKEDRLIALEFKTELTEHEQHVFAWLAEGLQYRAVASVLKIPVNEARNTARSCERKRERFQLLYDTGRLCGYRARTIQALQNGESTSEELAERAFAHLESCAHCRAEHKTNAKRLRRSFRDQAAALLPPVFIGHLGWLSRLGLRARLLLHRLGIDAAPVGQGGVRERTVALLAGGGVGKAVAIGVVTVSVFAGGAVATHVLERSPSPHRHRVAARAAATPRAAPPARRLLSTAPAALLITSARHSVHSPRHPHRSRARRVLASTHRPSSTSATGRREPGGFAYLGVPASSSSPSTSAQAASASNGQSGGGQFSP
jgi:DNA-directed RNA polymerase specialized sigma24 family protein